MVSPIWKNAVSLVAWDEVAGRVDIEQPHGAALDLATEKQGGGELGAALAQRLAVEGEDLAQGPADELRRLAHALDLHDGGLFRALALAGDTLVEQVDHRLGDREVSGRRQGDDPVPFFSQTFSFRKTET